SGTASLVYSTFLGRIDGNDAGQGIAVDGSGDAHVTGLTTSSHFPTMDAFQTSLGAPGAQNAFVTELNASGSALLYSTYLAVSGKCTALAGSGDASVTAPTPSGAFPTTTGAFQITLGGKGATNAFVANLDPSQSGTASLVYATDLGGEGNDSGNGIAVDGSG